MAELLRLEGVSLEGSDSRMVFRDLNWSLPPGGVLAFMPRQAQGHQPCYAFARVWLIPRRGESSWMKFLCPPIPSPIPF